MTLVLSAFNLILSAVMVVGIPAIVAQVLGMFLYLLQLLEHPSGPERHQGGQGRRAQQHRPGGQEVGPRRPWGLADCWAECWPECWAHG